MRYAILSDIHANEAALRAVLTDAADARAEKIICLGDVLGYGPDPVAALELIYREAHICLAGNHDDAVSGRCSARDFTAFAAAAVKRHRETLAPKAVDWLRRLPHVCELDGFACTHGDFSDPKNFNYILEPDDASASWAARSEQLLFVGHSHRPGIFVLGRSGKPHRLEPADFVLEDGKRYIVNPGSVGYPRSGSCRSSYCIFDTLSRTVFFRTLPFDLEQYRAKMHGEGMDEAPWLASREKERQHASVRNAEPFGKPMPPPRRSPSVPVPIIPAAANEKKNAGPRALVAAAVILAVVGLICTVKLTRALPERIRPLPEVTLPPAPAPAEPKDPVPAADSHFTKTVTLFGGWSASFENPEEQNVRIDRNVKKNATVFRIIHRKFHTVRFERIRKMTPEQDRIFCSVRLLTAALPGHRETFSFAARLVFANAAGTVLEESFKNGKQSAKWSVTVPDNAVSATLQIDCRCDGERDLAVPYFDFEEERNNSPRRKKGDGQ